MFHSLPETPRLMMVTPGQHRSGVQIANCRFGGKLFPLTSQGKAGSLKRTMGKHCCHLLPDDFIVALSNCRVYYKISERGC